MCMRIYKRIISPQKNEFEACQKEFRNVLDKFNSCESETERLKKELNELKNKYDNLSKENDHLKEHRDELISKLMASEQMLIDCQSSIKRLQDENENIRSTLNKVTLELELKMTSLAVCQTELENCKRTVKDLNNEMINLKNVLRDLNDENAGLKKNIDFYKKEMARLDAEIFHCQRASEEKDWKIAELMSRINELIDESEKCKLIHEATEVALKKANEDKKNMKRELDSLQMTINGLERVKDHLENDLNNCRNNLKKIGAELEQLRTDFENLSEIKEGLSKELSSCKTTIHSLSDSYKKIKDLLNKTQREKDECEASMRKLIEQNNQINKDLDDVKRKLGVVENNLNECLTKLKNEILDRKAKEKIIACLQDEIKFLKDKIDLKDQEFLALKLDRDNLQCELLNLHSKMKALKEEEPEDTPLNKLFKKIMKVGFECCELAELSELHECVIAATEKIVARGDCMPGNGPPVVKLEPKPRPLTKETKQFIVKLGPLHKKLVLCQEEARKRCCALTETVQKYQHELNSLRVWEIEFNRRLQANECQDNSKVAALKLRASQYSQSKLSHFIAAGCKKQQELVGELNTLSQALDRVETAQNAAVNNRLPEEAIKLAECLKTKLELACLNERRLQCLLIQEKQRTACLEYELCKQLQQSEAKDDRSSKNNNLMSTGFGDQGSNALNNVLTHDERSPSTLPTAEYVPITTVGPIAETELDNTVISNGEPNGVLGTDTIPVPERNVPDREGSSSMINHEMMKTTLVSDNSNLPSDIVQSLKICPSFPSMDDVERSGQEGNEDEQNNPSTIQRSLTKENNLWQSGNEGQNQGNSGGPTLGYNANNNTGKKAGINDKYISGENTKNSTECNTRASTGYKTCKDCNPKACTGYFTGVTTEDSSGATAGYNSGSTAGYSCGATGEYTSGVTGGYCSGATAVCGSRATTGYCSGETAGYNSGATGGYSFGATGGYNSGSTTGYYTGGTMGYNTGANSRCLAFNNTSANTQYYPCENVGSNNVPSLSYSNGPTSEYNVRPTSRHFDTSNQQYNSTLCTECNTRSNREQNLKYSNFPDMKTGISSGYCKESLRSISGATVINSGCNAQFNSSCTDKNMGYNKRLSGLYSNTRNSILAGDRSRGDKSHDPRNLDVSLDCGNRKRSVSFCNKVDTKYISSDSRCFK